MATVVRMPKLSYQMDQGTIVRWHKEEGDPVNKGEVLLELETDKAIFEFESPEAGFVRKILGAPDTPIPVQQAIAVLTETADETVDLDALDLKAPAATPASGPSASAPAAPSRAAGPQPRRGAPRSSPASRRLARELGVDLSRVTGTGPGGRIVEADVRAAASAQAAQPASAGEPLSRRNAAIAKRMVESKTTIPHFYVSVDLDLTDTETWRAGLGQEGKPTLSDILLKALGLSLREFPDLNASFERDRIVRHSDINPGLAVGLDEGLLVPVFSRVDRMSLKQIAEERSSAIEAARQGKMRASHAATFTLSNLGMFGVRAFSAIITPPEAAALAVGTLVDEPRVVDGDIRIRKILTATLSADHRLVDGLYAARFLADLRSRVEDGETVKAWL